MSQADQVPSFTQTKLGDNSYNNPGQKTIDIIPMIPDMKRILTFSPEGKKTHETNAEYLEVREKEEMKKNMIAALDLIAEFAQKKDIGLYSKNYFITSLPQMRL